MKVNFFTAYFLMWKRCVDFKGTSGLKEFWFPFIWQTIISVLTLPFILCIYLSKVFYWQLLGKLAWIPLIVLLVYLVVTILPFSALTIRRLKDAGKSGWWYLLILFVGVGTICLLILCSSGSAMFRPHWNEPVEIYGPPPMSEEDSEFDPSRNEPVVIYGPPSFEPEDEADVEFELTDNVNVCLYGPPEMFEEIKEEDGN